MKKNPLLILFSALLCFSVSPSVNAQKMDIGLSIGASTYQGDISPQNWQISFEGSHIARGIFLSIGLNDYISVKARYYTTNLSASDENAISTSRRERNLHFKTGIREFSLVGELDLLGVIPSFRKMKIRPFINIGIGIFRFNPQAKFRGAWYDLQPLGSEGQGLVGSKKEFYKLTQCNIPFGFGLKYIFNNNLVVAFEVSPRWTFTDYLDDVSTEYPDLQLLRQERGDMAVNLSYRNEKPIGDVTGLVGNVRGNSAGKDWYIITALSVAYRFDAGVYNDQRKGFQGNWKCPNF